MKQIILVLAILVSAISHANAQATDVTINNYTNCTVYFRLYGNTVGNCTAPNMTALYPIAAGTTGFITYASSQFGWTSSVFTHAVIQNADNIHCFGTFMMAIGEPCITPNTVTPTYGGVTSTSSGSCIGCGPVTATWTPGLGGSATLDFN